MVNNLVTTVIGVANFIMGLNDSAVQVDDAPSGTESLWLYQPKYTIRARPC